jgi:hypothetical protein
VRELGHLLERVTLKYALTHEGAYGSLSHERWRGLHAGIVEALEVLAPDRRAEQVERLAPMPCGARCGSRPSPTAGMYRAMAMTFWLRQAEALLGRPRGAAYSSGHTERKGC